MHERHQADRTSEHVDRADAARGRRVVPQVAQILALQRSAGNAQVARMLQRATITDESGQALPEVTTPQLVASLPPRIRRLLGRLPASLRGRFGALPQSTQQRLLLLEEDVQEAILTLPHAVLALLLSDLVRPRALPGPAEHALVPVAAAEPQLPDGLLDFLLGRVPADGIDLAALFAQRVPVPLEPLALMGPDTPAPLIPQPDSDDPLKRWALQLAKGDAMQAQRILLALEPYHDTPLRGDAKRELERAHGDTDVAVTKLAALKRLLAEQRLAAERSAKADYETEAEALKGEERDAIAKVPKPKKARGHANKRGPKTAGPTPRETLEADFKTRREGLDTTRQERADTRTAEGEKRVQGLTAVHDSELVERLVKLAGGNVKLVEALSPLLLLVGEDAEALAKEILTTAVPDTTALAKRCKLLLENDEADAQTAVVLACFLIKVPGAHAGGWVTRNGKRDRSVLVNEIAFLCEQRKYIAAAVCAVEELGLDGAESIDQLLPVGAPLIWVLQTMGDNDRTQAVKLVRAKPAEAHCIPLVFADNATAGAKLKTNAVLLAELAMHGPARYHDAHHHYVTTANFGDGEFATLLGLLATRPLAAALFYMGQDEVTVPPGVKVMGWVNLNNSRVRFPMAFSKSGYTTDPVCLKHYEEMGGGKDATGVSAAKMSNYFADLVAACDLAFIEFKKGKAKEFLVGVGRGQWKIIFKSSPEGPQVFHADSRYEGSYWTTHAS